MQLVLYTILICIAVVSNTQAQVAAGIRAARPLLGGNSLCGQGPRVNKAWDYMTVDERELYLESVEAAIARGYVQALVKVHMDRMSEMEAHDTCGFILWHRRFKLVFENILRSMDPKFACVTIPFWNTMEHFQNMVDGKCSSLLDCSKIITGIGGSAKNDGTVIYNRQSITKKCYGGRPYASYCDDTNNTCACVPRNDVSATAVPSGSSFVSLFSLISGSNSYADFTPKLQNGVHNEVHAAVGGVLSTFASPADVLFYSWHSTVDMIFYLWHRCHLENPLTAAEKRTSEYAFTQEAECRLTPKGKQNLKKLYTSESEIYMHADGADIRQHAMLGQYFVDVGSVYADFADARNMGDYTYSYEYPKDFNRMLNDKTMCPTASGDNTDIGETGSDNGDGELTQWEWYAQTRAKLHIKFPNDPQEVNRQLEYLECIGFNNKFGSQNFSQEFVDNFLEGVEVEPRCQQLLERIENNSSIVDTEDGAAWGQKVDKDASKQIKKQTKLKPISGAAFAQPGLILSCFVLLVSSALFF